MLRSYHCAATGVNQICYKGRIMKVFLSLVLGLAGAIAGAQTADTIYYNGKIVTMWANHPTVQAVAIRSGRFLAVGSTADVLKTAGPSTKKIDLGRQVRAAGHHREPRASHQRRAERDRRAACR